MDPKNLTPSYINYYSCKNGDVLDNDSKEFYAFTKQWNTDGITAVGWYPETKTIVVIADKQARKDLSKMGHTSWRTSDGRLFRIEIKPNS